ncbi:type III secretion system domain-containing protein [Pandoraea sp. PE-S2T-3]|uniref:type III secretion system domain-containing protein n=1 Tax=Pandoraea sp. PE-S2T-3 TaxID=1986993 RepID=UPI001594EAB9|nr:type III secretion system domain-containing protein [Pandoraea sp. PE-S2T-3]
MTAAVDIRVISFEATQLVQLIWQPGRFMDAGWWQALDMSPWQYVYHHQPATRPPIDRCLVERRGWPTTPDGLGLALPLSDAACVTLRLVPNLRRVALAYALRMLGCPDYLWLGDYRRALSPWLDAWQCDRLLLTRRDWLGRAAFTPDQLVDAAFTAMAALLDAMPASPSPSSDVSVACQATRILLPPGESERPAHVDLTAPPDLWARMAALEKMLCLSSTTR